MPRCLDSYDTCLSFDCVYFGTLKSLVCLIYKGALSSISQTCFMGLVNFMLHVMALVNFRFVDRCKDCFVMFAWSLASEF